MQSEAIFKKLKIQLTKQTNKAREHFFIERLQRT